MKLLTRSEEFVMLAIWRLQEEGYTLAIRKQVSQITGQEWSLSSIYTPLDRLTRKGYITSYLSEPTSKRGGRHKRIYEVTISGRQALTHIRRIEEAMWADIQGLLIAG